ncbi:MAG: hypothetical protein CMI16_03430 [Opitutaceae bacterium]|jgi:hypothetical protein|nr:hypothetical protein [Opitutaceae bacterium]|tara:strand:+ start:286 stop:510 length:225 start_codon:yes stop_codon:yes gene_type:complete
MRHLPSLEYVAPGYFFRGAHLANKVGEATFAIDNVELHFSWRALFGLGDELIMKTLGSCGGEEQGKNREENADA